MLSLLVLSLVVNAPVGAVKASAPETPLLAGHSINVEQPDGPAIGVEALDSKIDIRPNSDICYKIRAYIFTKGRNPQFLRETTCGPKAPGTKKLDGKPGFMPLDLKARPESTPQQ